MLVIASQKRYSMGFHLCFPDVKFFIRSFVTFASNLCTTWCRTDAARHLIPK